MNKTSSHISIALFGSVLGLILLLIHPACAVDIPLLKGRINDYANLIDPATERQLEAALTQFEQTDTTQILVLTVVSLEGEDLEGFALRVAEKWQPGQKNFDNGVLLLVAKKQRKIRIEVGYGLEGKLTDLVSGRIIRNVIVPQFKAGRFDQGIIDGVTAIVEVARGEFSAPSTAQRPSDRQSAPPGAIGLIALVIFTNLVGRLNRSTGALAGGVLAPIAGVSFFNVGVFGILALIPLGLAGGFLLSLMGGPLSFGPAGRYGGRRGNHWMGGIGGGGFSPGGFGGFSGGGGGFGGGGASGGW
jgi:uncharacterized protein